MKWIILTVAAIGTTLASQAGTNDWTALHTAASAGDMCTAKILLRRHPEYLNANEAGLHTPLHVAVFDGQTEIATALVAGGANVNAVDICGWTPLHTAACRGEKAAAELLATKGADINFKDKTGQTPLRLALKYKHADIAAVLREHGAHE